MDVGLGLSQLPSMDRNMKNLILALACAIFLMRSPVSAGDNAKVLFIGKQPDHPFGTHMYLHTSQMLAKCLAKNGDIESVISDGWPKDPAVLDGVTTIVVYTTPAAEFLLDSPHRDQVIQLLNDGAGLVTLHWASSVFEKNYERLGPLWMSCLGGTWISNAGLHTGESLLVQPTPAHPICNGWDEYQLHDEYYLNPVMTDEAIPLAQVSVNDKPLVVGWAFERSSSNGRRGRSFGTTLGHFYSNFQRPRFRRMIVNAILWASHETVPADGAVVDLSEDDLALPANSGE